MTNETENKKSFSQMRRQNRNQNIFQAVLIIVLIVVLNVFSSLVFFRADLTKEKRFSISEFSKQVLDSLDDDVYIEIFLKDNDLP
ncbi:MAG: Gldg family protein, partial [Bacteroidales bacterium]|nr:Gldg family protein [Bacteroidales bacterium]